MLLFMDGMGFYGTADLGVKYTEINSAECVFSVVPEGRLGRNCIKRVSTSSSGIAAGYLSVAPFATQTGYYSLTTSGVCGFALKIDDLEKMSHASQSLGVDIWSVWSSSGPHIMLGVTQDGTFILRSHYLHTLTGYEILLAQSIEGMQSNNWCYLEIKWLIDATVGTFELRLNTIPILTFTGNTKQDQYDGDLTAWNSIRLLGCAHQGPTPYLTVRMSDLYLADLTGGANDVKDFLGDGVIQTILPNGAGLAAGWTPATAAPNWDQVNDTPAPDGDTTYVSTTAPGTRDCHQFEDIPTGATVLGVHYNMLVRKETDGTVTVKPVVGQGGVQFDGPTQGVADITYSRYLTQPYDVNPATGAKWTAAEINAGQWGILKVT